MESRFYLFPGQTLENTKISQRSHALHITKNNWNKITKHLDRKKDIQDALDKEEQWKNYLAEGSRSMTEKWESSLENIRKRKEEERARRAEQKQDDRMLKYFELKKEQDKIKKEYIDKVRKQMFMTQGHAKELTSAFIFSEILYEREKQKEFKKFLDDHRKEEDAKFVELVKENAKQEELEKKMASEKLAEKKKNYGEYLGKIIKGKEDRNRKQKEDKINTEAMDNIKAAEEEECLRLEAEKLVSKKKQDLKYDYQHREEVAKQRKAQLDLEEKELNEVINIYQEAKQNIDYLRKKREAEIRKAMADRRDAVAKLVTVEAENKEEEEQRRIAKAIAEQEAAEDARVKEKIEFAKRAKQDRIEDRKKFLERAETQRQKEEELRKWEMVNRFKNEEVMKHYDELKTEERRQRILKYRKELLDLMAEVECDKKREKELEQLISRVSFEEADRMFFEYANEILEAAKAKGRQTYPIEKVIQKYKQENRGATDKSGRDKKQENGCVKNNNNKNVK